MLRALGLCGARVPDRLAPTVLARLRDVGARRRDGPCRLHGWAGTRRRDRQSLRRPRAPTDSRVWPPRGGNCGLRAVGAVAARPRRLALCGRPRRPTRTSRCGPDRPARLLPRRGVRGVGRSDGMHGSDAPPPDPTCRQDGPPARSTGRAPVRHEYRGRRPRNADGRLPAAPRVRASTHGVVRRARECDRVHDRCDTREAGAAAPGQ